MFEAELEWHPVFNSNKLIGMVAFRNSSAVIVISYYDDGDYDQDGRVSLGERIASSIGSVLGLRITPDAISTVMYCASFDPEVQQKDLDFARYASMHYWSVQVDAVRTAAYKLYLNSVVSSSSGALAGLVTRNKVAKLAIKNGLEREFEQMYKSWGPR